jgi:hypothetical protein
VAILFIYYHNTSDYFNLYVVTLQAVKKIMKKKNILKGVLFVGIGASIYGMLATFVKMAYHDGFTTSEVTTAQFVLGLAGLLILNFIQTLTSKQNCHYQALKKSEC